MYEPEHVLVVAADICYCVTACMLHWRLSGVFLEVEAKGSVRLRNFVWETISDKNIQLKTDWYIEEYIYDDWYIEEYIYIDWYIEEYIYANWYMLKTDIYCVEYWYIYCVEELWLVSYIEESCYFVWCWLHWDCSCNWEYCHCAIILLLQLEVLHQAAGVATCLEE